MIIFARVASYKKRRYTFHGVVIRSAVVESSESDISSLHRFSTRRRVLYGDPTGRKNKSEAHNLFEGIALSLCERTRKPPDRRDDIGGKKLALSLRSWDFVAFIVSRQIFF